MALSNLLLIIACAVTATTVRAQLTASPTSVAAVIGETVWLHCNGSDTTSDHKYTWLFNQLQQPVPITIAFDCEVNPNYADLYVADPTEDGECNLGIRNIDYSSAGTYTCQHSADQGAADLVVLNSNSACSFGPNDLISGESITIQCALNYQGPRTPHMDFRSETGQVYTNATITPSPTQVTGMVTFPVYPPTTRAVTANTYFDPPITYSLTWTLPTLRVQFPPTNVHIDIAGEGCQGYHAGHTVLTCTGDAWPPATFTWLDLDTGETFNGPTITLTKLGDNHFSCVVQNEIRDVSYDSSENVTLNLIEGEPSTCPPETTTSEPTTTTTPEPTTTTTPEPTTTTITITECGSRWRVAPPEAPITPGWQYMCYINRTDVQWLDTACYDLLHDFFDIGDYNSLLALGGAAGCALLTSDESSWSGADYACLGGYQIFLSLNQCTTCSRLVMCIQLP